MAQIVDGVTKLERVSFDSRAAAQAATMRKMLVAMAKDPRVLLIKLGDRLHNMRTVAAMPEANQKRTAQETLDIYAPLAHRFGIADIKWQLEDLAFATLHPRRYAEIEQMVAARAPERDVYLAQVIEQVQERLLAARIEAQVTGRPKHLYSIYEKMVLKNKEFDEIYDLVGVRVIVSSVKDCWAALGRHPRDLGARAGAVQGLHKYAQVQPLPVAAHHGRRRRRASPSKSRSGPGDAQPGGTGDRRPLGLQGERLGGRRRLVAADRGLVGGEHGPRRVPRGV